jgi:hypothetical protein
MRGHIVFIINPLKVIQSQFAISRAKYTQIRALIAKIIEFIPAIVELLTD